jgi:arylsulfatase A-like enzyme/Flp pilus assembly protein TadD
MGVSGRLLSSLVVLHALVALGCSGGGGDGLLGSTRTGAAAGYNVLLVTLDTTRADHLGCYGSETAETPVLDGLAAEGVRFEEAVTAAPLTGPAHATILTGLYPPNHGVRSNASYRLRDDARTLAERLRDEGYTTAAFVAAFVLHGRFGFDQGFETYDDDLEPESQGRMQVVVDRTATEVTDRAVQWLNRLDGETPFFAWVHYFDPHLPYTAPPRVAERFSDPYDAEIAYADEQVGRLIRTLAARGLDRRTVIVVVGDHGEALGDHEEQHHGYFIYRSVMHVPLILHAPQVLPAGRVVDGAVVSVADVVPTVAELLGLDPEYTDGRSLVTGGTDPDRTVYQESLNPYLDHGWAPLFGLRRYADKYIEAPIPEYYDLLADPLEQVNRYEEVSGRALVARDELASDLDSRLADWPPIDAVADQAVTLDPEALERLRSLGYVGGAAATASDDLADPKQKLESYLRFERAQDLVADGRPMEALEIFEELAADSPDNRAALDHLARGYVMVGRFDRAEATVRRLLAIRADPDSLMLLAQVLIAERRLDEVDALVEQSLAIDPEHGMTILVQGDLAARRGRFEEASAFYRRAEQVDPFEAGPLVESRRAWLRQMQAGRQRP